MADLSGRFWLVIKRGVNLHDVTVQRMTRSPKLPATHAGERVVRMRITISDRVFHDEILEGSVVVPDSLVAVGDELVPIVEALEAE